MNKPFDIFRSLVVVMLVGLAACGYKLEGSNPQLPSDSTTLAIVPIQNRTFQAGLETRLMRHLVQLFRNNASINLVVPQDADLVLDIKLQTLDAKQTSVSADGSTVELQLELSGSVVLKDRKQDTTLWSETGFNARGILLYDKGETSMGLSGSSIGRGLDEVTNAFAERVYERIFIKF